MKPSTYTLIATLCLAASSALAAPKAQTPKGVYAIISPCKSKVKHFVKMGKRIQPSNTCRVVNYFNGKKWLGAVALPQGEETLIEWGLKEYDRPGKELQTILK